MSAKQSNRGNKITVRRLCIYAIFTAICLVFGFIESLLPLDFIAPGIKPGLANSVAVLLVFKGDIKGAFAVNTARILLSALLFGSAVSLIFSLSAGIISTVSTVLFSRLRSLSIIGVSMISGAVHNAVQLVAASIITDTPLFYYAPVLLICGGICGAVTGLVCRLIIKKFNTDLIF